MKLFHVVRGDDPVGNRLGCVLRIFDGIRDFEILLIAPAPGRWTTICDYYKRVIVNAKFHAYIVFGYSRGKGFNGWRGFEMRRDEQQKDTGRTASVWNVLP